METDKTTLRGASGAASAKEQVRELANAGREQVAGQLDCFARALQGAGDQLESETPQASQYTRMAGDKVGEVARYLRDHDAADLVHDAEDFARSNPLVFLGGCAIAGFLIGRFFKASPDEEAPSGRTSDDFYEYTPVGTPAYDARVSTMPRTPAIDRGDASVVTAPTINTPDPWNRGGNGSGV